MIRLNWMGHNWSPLAKRKRFQESGEVSTEMWHWQSTNNNWACRKEEEGSPFGGPISPCIHSAKVCQVPAVAKCWEGESNREFRSLSLSTLQREHVFGIWHYCISLLGDKKHREDSQPTQTFSIRTARGRVSSLRMYICGSKVDVTLRVLIISSLPVYWLFW